MYQDMAESSPKMGITCVYVVGGKEVIRRVEKEHPGMDSFELEEYEHMDRQTKMHFAWDHLGPKGEHVFRGTKVRV